MPVTKSAAKSLRVSRHKKVFNDKTRRRLSEAVKKAAKKPTSENVKSAAQIADRAVKKKIIHANRAGRLKSRLARLTAKSKNSAKKSA